MNNDLFDNNINLVNKIVNKMNYGYVDKDDLTQAGLIGLYKATLKYKKEINNNFISYASIYIINEIKDDVIDGNNATVTAEITVTDFRKVMNESESYMNNNITEFSDEQGNYSILKYNDYRLERLNNAKDKIKYTIYLNLTKVNDEWVLNDIDQITYDKINGTYFY